MVTYEWKKGSCRRCGDYYTCVGAYNRVMTFYILTYGHRKKYDHCIISDYAMEAMVSPSAPTRVERNIISNIIMADNNSRMEQADIYGICWINTNNNAQMELANL